MLQRKPRKAAVITNMYFSCLTAHIFTKSQNGWSWKGSSKLTYSISLSQVPQSPIQPDLRLRDRASKPSLGNLCHASASLQEKKIHISNLNPTYSCCLLSCHYRPQSNLSIHLSFKSPSSTERPQQNLHGAFSTLNNPNSQSSLLAMFMALPLVALTSSNLSR